MDKISLKIGTWTLAFSTIEMLFHTFKACPFLFIIFVVEAILGLRIHFNTLVSYRVDVVIFVLSSGNLSQLFLISKVWLISVSHWNPVKFVTTYITSNKTWVQSLILVGYLFLDICQWRGQLESRHFSNGMFGLLEVSIVLRTILSGLWWTRCLEIDVSTREPCKFRPWLERPVWLIARIRRMNFFSN